MAYFYNSHSGQVQVASQSLNPLAEASFLQEEALLHTGTGWHEYSTQAEMLAAIAQNHWPAPNSGSTGVSTNVLTGTASSAAQNVAKGAVDGILNGFKLVFQGTTGLLGRILKMGLGGVLMIAGIMRITNAKKDIIQIAGTAVKGAML